MLRSLLPTALPAKGTRAPSFTSLALTALCALLFALAGVSSASAAEPPRCSAELFAKHEPCQFGAKGQGAGEFESPRGIAISQEAHEAIIADRGNARVDAFATSGPFLRAFGWGVSSANEELQTCTTHCVAGFEGPGAGEFSSPVGIAVDNDALSSSHGDVYVWDQRNLRVQKFSASGEFILMFGGEVNATSKTNLCLAGEACQAGVEGTGPGQFQATFGNPIAVGPEGTVFLGDRNRVQEFSAAGAVSGEVKLPGSGAIVQLAVDSSKDLYVKSGELAGVRKYDLTGKALGSPRDEAGSPGPIAIGAGNELFLSDSGHILAFNAAGTQLAAFGAGVEASVGIAYDQAEGAIYSLGETAVSVVPVPPPGPVVLASVSEVLPTSAVAQAIVNPEGAATEYHFEYGTTAAYGESTAAASLTAVNEVQSVTLTATGGAFTLAFNGEASPEIPFGATSGQVQAALEAISGLGAGQVAVSGEAGGPWSVEFTGVRAGQDVPELTADASSLTGPEPAVTLATTTPGISLFDDRAVSAALKGLRPGTTYHLRVVASNANGIVEGPDVTFATLPPVSIDSESVSQVTAYSARLEAELNAHGFSSEYHFEYGPSAAYGTSVPVPDASAGAGTVDASFEVALQGLTPQTVYHYRVVAHNSLGAVQGPDRTFQTEGSPSAGLADGRAWELVSPADKHGSSLEAISEEGGIIQAAENGDGLAYFAKAPVDKEPAGSRSIADTQLLASRSPTGGWSTQDLATPHEEVTGFTPGHLSEYQLFSGDLSAGFVEPEGKTPLSEQAGERTPYRREANGQYTPLVTPANVAPGVKYGGTENEPGHFIEGVAFVSATPDGSHVLLRSSQALTPGFTSAGKQSLYEWSAGALRLVSVLANGAPAAEEGETSSLGKGDLQVRHAVSDDGSRVVFETEHEGKRLWLRDVVRGETVQLDVRAVGAKGGAGVPVFQVASSDGSRVFFTDTASLTVDASGKGEPELYMCEVGVMGGHLACTLKDLSVDGNAGEAANVLGTVVGSDEAGRLVYFVANGALAPGATHGNCVPEVPTAASSCNLYVVDTVTGVRRLVAILSGNDERDWAPFNAADLGAVTSRVSGNGGFVAFMSQRGLTGFDNRDARSGVRDQEVFLFDAAGGGLRCVSCSVSGARPVGVFDAGVYPGLLVDRPELWTGQTLAGSIPGWTKVDNPHALYQSRYLSDSGRLFFNSPVGLVAGDGNGREDVYEFEPFGVGGCRLPSGCVSLISGGGSSEESAFLDASASGDDVFFMSAAKLVPSDFDDGLDVYDAHVCSGGSPCPGVVSVPPACTTADSCRAAPAAQPVVFGAPSSATFSGPGNMQPGAPRVVRPLTRAQKLARALKACHKQHNKHRRLVCEKQARKRYGRTSSSQRRHKP